MKKMYMFLKILLVAVGCMLFIQPIANAADSEGNLVIVLDPGHGGSDPGAMNNSLGLKESDINYKIARYTKEELEKYEGVKVYLTRYADCPSIYERGEFAKRYQADLVVSQHINSGASSASGAEVWVTQDNTQIEFYQKSKEVGEKILNKLSALGLRSHGVSTRSGQPNEWYKSGVVKDYYGIIRYPMNYDIRSILVEHCYISNNSDCRSFISTDAQIQRLGIADAQGIVEAYQLEKKNTGKQPVRFFALDKSELNLEITAGDPQPVNYVYPIFTPSNCYNQEVDYYSSNPEVLRVYWNRMRGLKEGEATITAITKNNQRIAKCKVRVTKPQVALQDIKADKTKMVLDINQKEEIHVTFTPNNASDKTLYWKSSNPDVARVWEGGVRGLKEGTSTITAISKAGGKQISCEVTVKDPNKVYVQDVNFEKQSYDIEVDEAVDIPYSYAPTNATNAEFSWTSTNPDVLRVYWNRMRGLKPGTAQIIFKTLDGTFEKRINVTVGNKKQVRVQDMQVQENYSIKVNEAVDIPYTYTSTTRENVEFSWTSTNPDVLRVYWNRMRGLKPGTAEIIVSTLDKTFEKRIKVTVGSEKEVKVQDVQVQDTYTIKVDEAIDIPYTFSPTNSTNAEFDWISTEPEKLRVYWNRMRGLKPGTAEIIIRTLDKTFEKRIKVNIVE